MINTFSDVTINPIKFFSCFTGRLAQLVRALR